MIIEICRYSNKEGQGNLTSLRPGSEFQAGLMYSFVYQEKSMKQKSCANKKSELMMTKVTLINPVQ